MIKHTKKILQTSFKILLAGGIIYWLVKEDKLNFAALKSLCTPLYLTVALGLTVLCFVLVTERWRQLLKTQNVDLPFFSLFKLSMIGLFFNFAMPGGVGGDVVKGFYFYKQTGHARSIAISSVFVDRLLGLYTMVVMAVLVMIYDLKHILSIPVLESLFYLFSVIFLGFTLALYLFFTRQPKVQILVFKLLSVLPMKEKFQKLYQSTQLYGKSLRTLSLVFAISLLAQTLSIVFFIIAGEASGLGEGVPWSTYFLVAPLGFMATAVPISPAGVGVGQAAFFFLFNTYLGYSSEIGPTVITAFQMFQFLFGFSGVFFYLRMKDKIQLPKAGLETE